MADAIFSNTKSPVLARYAALKSGASPFATGSTASKPVADTITLSPAAQERINSAKKLNGYLQIFDQALKIINSGGNFKLPSSLSDFEKDGFKISRSDTSKT